MDLCESLCTSVYVCATVLVVVQDVAARINDQRLIFDVRRGIASAALVRTCDWIHRVGTHHRATSFFFTP